MAITLADQETRLSRKGLAAVRALRTLEATQDEIALKIKAQKLIIEVELGGTLELGGKVVGTDARGNKLVSIKSSIVRRINASMLRKRDPELAEECTTESERKTITLAPVDA